VNEYAPLAIAAPGARAYAFAVDWHVRVLLLMLWLLIGLPLIGVDAVTEDFFSGDGSALSAWLWPAVAIYVAYHPIVELLMRGDSPGKRFAGLRVIDRAGRAPSVGAILLRNALRLIDGFPGFYALGLLLCATSPEHTRLGDRIAGTRVAFRQSPTAAASNDDPLAVELNARWPELSPTARARLREVLGQR
jgi:uncharacterized RDD family membrane protein YckC